MKRIYFLLIALLALTGKSFAQVDLAITPYIAKAPNLTQFMPVTNGTTLLYSADEPQTYIFAWKIKNVGTSGSLAIGDTLKWKTPYLGGGYFYAPLTKVLAVGDSIVYTDSLQPQNSSASQTLSVNWCDSVWARKVGGAYNNDPVLSNNRSCATVSLTIWATGINEVANNNGFALYPNPVSSKMNIKYNFSNSSANVVIRDLIGRVVFQQELGNNLSGEKMFDINVADLASGVYILQLNAGDKKEVARFTVQK